jgi:hypothetical protein
MELCQRIAKAIASGAVVGYAHSATARFCAIRGAPMKDILNLKIKRRELPPACSVDPARARFRMVRDG